MPAYGRGVLLEEQLDRSWVFSPQIFRDLHGKLWEDTNFRTNLSDFVPSKNIPIPIFGMWVLSKIPENATFEVLLAKILELRETKEVIRFHELFQLDNITSDIVKQEVYRELINELNFRKKENKYKIGINGELKIPIYFMEIKASLFNGDINQISIRRFLNRHIKMRKTSTLITKLLENSILTNETQQKLLKTAISILTSIKK